GSGPGWQKGRSGFTLHSRSGASGEGTGAPSDPVVGLGKGGRVNSNDGNNLPLGSGSKRTSARRLRGSGLSVLMRSLLSPALTLATAVAGTPALSKKSLTASAPCWPS